MSETKQNIREQIKALRVALDKTESEIFVKSNDSREAISYKSLNEVKRHFEDNHIDFLKSVVTTADKKLNSKEFHALLDKLVENAQ